MPKVYIIAEAGVNHNGSLEMAISLIDVAAKAGADAVKFQTFKAENLVSRNAEKADYQKKTTDKDESQFEMIKKLELDLAAHQVLIQHCQKLEIQFLSTPFDLESLSLLVNILDLPLIKIASGEITNAPFLLKIAQFGKPIILSTGMSTLGEVEQALGVLAFGYLHRPERPSIQAFQRAWCSLEGQQILIRNVTLLHCTTEYPAPYSNVNLKAMDTLKYAFGLPVGFSDHTPGIAIPLVAVARGAVLIEKHFTLDKNLPGPDHQASLEPNELCGMVEGIRAIEMSLGDGVKVPSPVEMKNIPVARKSLVAAKTIQKGEIFTEDNLTTKRPGTGKSPIHYWEWLGKKAERGYLSDEVIE